MNARIGAVLAVGPLFLAACSAHQMYSGPPRPCSEISVVKVARDVTFVSINSESPGEARKVAIDPGEHGIRLRYRQTHTCLLSVVTKPGRSYVARGSAHAGGFKITLFDKKTRDVVASCGG